MNKKKEQVVMKLTHLEKQVLKELFKSAEGNGHDFGFTEDARNAVSSPRQLSGVISSLTKKKILSVYEPATNDEGVTYCQFYWLMPVEQVEAMLAPPKETTPVSN